MRRAATFAVVAVLAAGAGWAACWFTRPPSVGHPPPAPSPAETDGKLAGFNLLEPVFVAGGPGDRGASRVEFEGKTFWLVDLHWGMGVPYKAIGLYAPNRDGRHVLVLSADSCGAGHVVPELDAATGMLVLRERARSELEGQVILSCNLRSVGTYRSVHGE